MPQKLIDISLLEISLIPKEEPIDFDNFLYPEFFFTKDGAKKGKSNVQQPSKPVRHSTVPHIVKKPEDKNSMLFQADIQEY